MRRFSTWTSASSPPKVAVAGSSLTTCRLVSTSPDGATTKPLPVATSTPFRSTGTLPPPKSTRTSATTRMKAMALQAYRLRPDWCLPGDDEADANAARREQESERQGVGSPVASPSPPQSHPPPSCRREPLTVARPVPRHSSASPRCRGPWPVSTRSSTTGRRRPGHENERRRAAHAVGQESPACATSVATRSGKGFPNAVNNLGSSGLQPVGGPHSGRVSRQTGCPATRAEPPVPRGGRRPAVGRARAQPAASPAGTPARSRAAGDGDANGRGHQPQYRLFGRLATVA